MSFAEKAVQAFENQDVEKAVEFIQSSMEQDPLYKLEELGEWLFMSGYLVEARLLYEALQNRDGYQEESNLRLAEIAIEEGKDNEALEELEHIGTNSPYYVQSLLVAADLYQTQGLFEVSEEKLKEARELLPDEPVILFALAELHYTIGRYGQSLREYEQLFSKGMTEFAGVDLSLRLAELNSLTGRFDEAIAFYKKILKKEESLNVLFQLAVTYLQLNDPASAIPYLIHLKEADPYYVSLYPLLAEAYEMTGEKKLSLDVLEEGLSADQTNPGLFLSAARLYLKSGQKESAKEYFEKVLSLQPENEEARLALSELAEEETDPEEALAILSSNEGEADPLILWRRAAMHEELEEYKEAGELYEKAAPFLLSNDLFLNDYLLFLRDEGKWEQAEKILKKAISKGQLSQENQLFLGSLIRKE